MEAVDVLGDQRMERAAPLEGGERQMPGVGLGLPRGRLEPTPPGARADVGVGEIVLERRELFGAGVPGPHALRPAEIGDAGVGGDPGARQRHDAFGLVDPAADGLDHLSSETSTSTDFPLTRTAGSDSSRNPSSRSRQVVPLTRISEPISLLRSWIRDARLTVSPTSAWPRCSPDAGTGSTADQVLD